VAIFGQEWLIYAYGQYYAGGCNNIAFTEGNGKLKMLYKVT
jgi:hypothetical protein